MLLYVKERDMIINLDQIRSILSYGDYGDIEVHAVSTNGEIIIICECENKEEASKIINNIYTKMTYGNENMILNLEEFRKTETAKTRRTLRNNKCNSCIYVDTDGCKEWDNDGTGCDAYITEEEARKYVNEEK